MGDRVQGGGARLGYTYIYTNTHTYLYLCLYAHTRDDGKGCTQRTHLAGEEDEDDHHGGPHRQRRLRGRAERADGEPCHGSMSFKRGGSYKHIQGG